MTDKVFDLLTSGFAQGFDSAKISGYSYTQISQYLACPRRDRHRYLSGWVEKDDRAALLFGRAF